MYSYLGQWGADVDLKDSEYGVCGVIHIRDVVEMGCIWSVEIFYKCLDLLGFRNCLCKYFHVI